MSSDRLNRSWSSYGSISSSSNAPFQSTSASNGNCSNTDAETIIHTVSKDDTLQGVAIRYGVSMAEIKRDNNLWTNDSLLLRKTLSIHGKAVACDRNRTTYTNTDTNTSTKPSITLHGSFDFSKYDEALKGAKEYADNFQTPEAARPLVVQRRKMSTSSTSSTKSKSSVYQHYQLGVVINGNEMSPSFDDDIHTL